MFYKIYVYLFFDMMYNSIVLKGEPPKNRMEKSYGKNGKNKKIMGNV